MVESPRWHDDRLWFPQFMMCNDSKGPDKFDEMIASRTAKVLIADAPAPAAGWP